MSVLLLECFFTTWLGTANNNCLLGDEQVDAFQLDSKYLHQNYIYIYIYIYIYCKFLKVDHNFVSFHYLIVWKVVR